MSFKLAAYRALEHEEQTALFAWAKVEEQRDPRLSLLFAIPNGTAAVSLAEASRAKRTGRKKGVPDMFLPIACDGYHGLFIELKRSGGAPCDVRPEQSIWLKKLNAHGYRAVVAYGWQDAVEIIQTYLGGT
jgi:hypothetical protein